MQLIDFCISVIMETDAFLEMRLQGLLEVGLLQEVTDEATNNRGALMITYTILGVPYSIYSIMGPQTLF